MATKKTTRRSNGLSTRVAVLESKLIDHETDLKTLDSSIDSLRETINKWSGAILVVTPLVAFFGTLLGNKLFQ